MYCVGDTVLQHKDALHLLDGAPSMEALVNLLVVVL